jgi:hypothetical protein
MNSCNESTKSNLHHIFYSTKKAAFFKAAFLKINS